MSICIAVIVVWLYHGSPEVSETEKMSPPNINKTCFICIYKTVCKVKLEDVIRTADWLLIVTPSASFPTYSARPGRCCERQRPSVGGPAHLLDISQLIHNDKLVFFGDLWSIFAFLKISRHWSIAWVNLLKNNTLTGRGFDANFRGHRTKMTELLLLAVIPSLPARRQQMQIGLYTNYRGTLIILLLFSSGKSVFSLQLLHLFFLCYEVLSRDFVLHIHIQIYTCTHTHTHVLPSILCGGSPEFKAKKYINCQVRILTSSIFATF